MKNWMMNLKKLLSLRYNVFDSIANFFMRGLKTNMLANNLQNNLSFTSTPIKPIRLKGLNNKYVKAVFTKLDSKNAEDINAIEKLYNDFGDKDETLKGFCMHFFDKNADFPEYFALEKKEGRTLSDRIIGVFECMVNDFDYQGTHLFVKPQYQFKNKNREITNPGKAILAFIVNAVKAKKLEGLTFCSTNNAFYNKIFSEAGIEFNRGKSNFEILPQEGKYTDYFIHKDDCDKFLSHIEKNSGIKFGWFNFI